MKAAAISAGGAGASAGATAMPKSQRWKTEAAIPISGHASDAVRYHRTVAPHHFDGQGMDAALQLGIQRLHDGAVLLQAGLAGELIGRDTNAEMRLAPRSRTGMTFMSVALIEHFKMARSEFSGKFLNNRVANSHMDTGSGAFWTVKRN